MIPLWIPAIENLSRKSMSSITATLIGEESTVSIWKRCTTSNSHSTKQEKRKVLIGWLHVIVPECAHKFSALHFIKWTCWMYTLPVWREVQRRPIQKWLRLILRSVECGEEILKASSMMHADVVGFHGFDHARHFWMGWITKVWLVWLGERLVEWLSASGLSSLFWQKELVLIQQYVTPGSCYDDESRE